jgi:CubicO group peptidase (beta-lactamase class C family)
MAMKRAISAAAKALLLLLACCFAGCGCERRPFVDVDYTPEPGGDWEVSTPVAEGLDSTLVDRLYSDATYQPTLYGLLVIKNDRLVAEKYFNKGAIDQLSGRQSVTKSYVSACVGLAIEKGYLSNLDQRMMEFFPGYADSITDPRKNEITLRQMLQMRAGFPWEENEPPWFDVIFRQDSWPYSWQHNVADVPLTSDPGMKFGYSNLSSHLLAIALARGCSTSLDSFAREYLFEPMDAELGGWTRDRDGYCTGWAEIYVTARDMAKFGSVYLHGGRYRGTQVVPEEWVSASLERYSEGINFTGWLPGASELGKYLREVGYGYLWWSARAGKHRFDFAWGHGGQLIVRLDDLDMIVVTTADPLYEAPGESGWQYEGGIIDMVGKFINSLPNQ